MCTSAEPETQGHDACAGAGRKIATTSAISPEPSAMLIVSSSLSAPDLTSTFHDACSSAAPSTASVTGRLISTLEQDLLDERHHALDRDAAFGDRFFRAVVLHRAEVRQQRRDQDVRRLAGEAAAGHPLLDDVERGVENFEDRGNHRIVAGSAHRAEPARAQALEPALLLALHHFAALDPVLPAALAGMPELAPAEIDRDDEIRTERPAHRHRYRIHQAAVDQVDAVADHRREQARRGERGPDPPDQRAVAEPGCP